MRWRMPPCLAPVLAIAVSGIACSPSPSSDSTQPQAASSRSAEEGQSSEGQADGAEAVSVRVVDLEGYQQTIERHRGKVVLVDFWATWCVPCKQQFPHTVRMAREYADEGLAAVSVSLDAPEDEDRVLAFLRDQKATFGNLISAHGGSDKSLAMFEIDSGAVPHYKLYDRTGTLRYEFGTDPTADPFTPEDIEEKVQELLAEPMGGGGSG